MKSKSIILAFLLFVTMQSFSQKFYLGDRLTTKSSQFKLLGISSTTGVHTYKYLGSITDKYFFNRRVGEIIVGLKNDIIVTTIYNLIPENGDVGVPQKTLNLIENSLPFPLSYKDGIYGVSIDNTNITISRTKNALTFNLDRIMFFTSIKNSILSKI